jgi:hypothetical protein
METTVTVDISMEDIPNFAIIESFNLSSYNEEGQKILLDKYPFRLYIKRTMGKVTIQIPLKQFVFFYNHKLIS